jgi:hypothetical protein
MIYRIFLFFLIPRVFFGYNLRKTFSQNQWTTHQNKIYLNGNDVNIKGITWNGLNSDTISFSGLWKHSLEFFMDQLRLQLYFH